jgi:hypothetical protein
MDVVELRLAISECARGGAEIPLVFRPYDPLLLRPQGPNEFAPYELLYCGQYDQSVDWTYDVVYYPGVVKVLGSQPACGDPPPDLGVRVLLGSVTASPGELVEVPVFAAAEAPMSLLRLTLEQDPAVVSVEAVDFEVYWEKTGEFVRRVVTRGQGDMLSECDTSVPPVCWEGVPELVVFRDNADARFVHLDISPNESVRSYPGPELHEIARLRVRVREDYEGVETLLKPAAIPYGVGQTATFFETGGYMPSPDRGVFSPAREVRGGTISIRGRGFLRGDSNSDGKVDLSDAVATLGFLFLGGETPACMDAADADDRGTVEITDAILLLGVLFLGNGAVPQPYPDCGSDPTSDALGCERNCGSP